MAEPSAPKEPPLGRPLQSAPSRRDLVRQAWRFALSGGLVSALYVLTTIALADLLGLPFEIALPIGFAIGLTTHFTLQRLFVWARDEDFALPLHHQLGRYLLVAAGQYGVTAASTALLPSRLGVSTDVVYLATVVAIGCGNFFVFRHGIFHVREPAGDVERSP